jgi:hypothetical protein
MRVWSVVGLSGPAGPDPDRPRHSIARSRSAERCPEGANPLASLLHGGVRPVTLTRVDPMKRRPEEPGTKRVEIVLEGPGRAIDAGSVSALDAALSGVTESEILHAIDPARVNRFEEGGPPVWSVASGARRGGTLHVTYGLSGVLDQSRGPISYEFSLAMSGPGQWWPLSLLRQMAKYVLLSRRELKVGDFFQLHAPLPAAVLGPNRPPSEPDTHLTAVAVAADPVIPRVETPRGPVEIRRLYGLSNLDLEMIETWSCAGFMDLVRRRDPELVTDLGRSEWRADRAFVQERDDRARKEGATAGALVVPGLRWQGTGDGYRVVVPGAHHALRIARMMQARLPFGRNMLVHDIQVGPGTAVAIVPGTAMAVRANQETLELVLGAETMLGEALASGSAMVLTTPGQPAIHWDLV